jgi:putative hydrolase of the HAD superfamily
MEEITAIFLDVGGVLLTNGWDRNARREASERFHLDMAEMDERHHLTFDTYEEGKLSLNEYLERVVFYEPRPFTVQDFKEFMFSRSQPFPEMIDYIKSLKQRYHLHIAVISNEGRELMEYRITKFQLEEFVDFFIVSSFVHFRKPDKDIYKITLDVAQIPAKNGVYIDDREMFVQVATTLGVHGVHHTGLEATQSQLACLGLDGI